MNESYFKYWGKAKRNPEDTGPEWHPLVYHCLDVAAVALSWWDESPVIRRVFASAFGDTQCNPHQLRGWILFFIALHDLGKLDARFQLKSLRALASAGWQPANNNYGLVENDIERFDHGHAGLAWAKEEYQNWIDRGDEDREIWDRWQPLLTAVTGHHGEFHSQRLERLTLDVRDETIGERDKNARAHFVLDIATLFLKPAKLSLQELPPLCSEKALFWLAGFCSVSDWIGSNSDIFDYQPNVNPNLNDYLHARIKKIEDQHILRHFGLVAKARSYKGVSTLLKSNESPRGVQVKVDQLPLTSGLTLIEAPTGSGKTEAALAYAWRLLDQGLADSIVFALPTQATANAMLERIEAFAEVSFGDANVVLAHGKSRFNQAFQQLILKGKQRTAQGSTEAAAQCSAWLANSRKRVFLGQIGVCTVDQVLLSVLPVRHKFVRGFGLNKSVLIVDEVHAYDAYMNGLLSEVLRRQKATGGSAILLSATLPTGIREKLFQTWECTGQEGAPYPALWHATQDSCVPITLPSKHRPERREVLIECLKLPNAFPDDALLERIISAAQSGAKVAVIMNLVDNAQRLAQLLKNKTAIEVDLFHARYRFEDRQKKEKFVLDHYGRNASRDKGRILVATQVVEQSLDLDFDWMLTQICPVDLLFQRMGRLHRHKREYRPPGFELPSCTVLSMTGSNYGAHEYIYGNTRVLWRTERLISEATKVVFSSTEENEKDAYRDWIERVYSKDFWDDETSEMQGAYIGWTQEQNRREAEARRLTTITTAQYRDEENAVTCLTRDSEMSLTVLPLQSGRRLLDGQELEKLNEHDLAEKLNLNSIPVPASWRKYLSDCSSNKDGDLAGYYQLEMKSDGEGGWISKDGQFRYSQDFGLQKKPDR